MQPRNLVVLVMIATAVWGMTQLQRHNFFAPKAATLEMLNDFDFVTLSNNKGHLYQFENKNVVVHFWATWCPPCIKEFPRMIDYAQQRPDLVFILVSADRDRGALNKFMAPYQQKLKKSPHIISVHDIGMKLASHFKVTGFPESFIIGTDKSIRNHFVGDVKWDSLNRLLPKSQPGS